MTAEDILADAKRLTQVYAERLQQGRTTAQGRVYVLLLNSTVLGVLSTLERARQEAASLAAKATGPWEQVQGDIWMAPDHAVLRISTHDVR